MPENYKCEYKVENMKLPQWNYIGNFNWFMAAGIVFSIGIFAYGIFRAWAYSDRFIFIVLVIYLVVFIFVMRMWGKAYKMAMEKYGHDDWHRVIVIDDHGIAQTELTSKGTIPEKYAFSDITELKEDDNDLTLSTTDRSFIRLKKDSFTVGNWEDCRQFIENHMKKVTS